MTPQIPKPLPTPPPVQQEVNKLASDSVLKQALAQKKGKKTSFLTKNEQASKKLKNSLLGHASKGL